MGDAFARRIEALEREREAIRVALRGYPDSDLASLAQTMTTRLAAVEAENERLRGRISTFCARCGVMAPCIDSGEAYICADRDMCAHNVALTMTIERQAARIAVLEAAVRAVKDDLGSAEWPDPESAEWVLRGIIDNNHQELRAALGTAAREETRGDDNRTGSAVP